MENFCGHSRTKTGRIAASVASALPNISFFTRQPLRRGRLAAKALTLWCGGDPQRAGRQRPVHALVALEHVVGEEAARAQLGYAQGERAHARDQLALPVAVPAVAGVPAELVRLRAHHLVDDGLRQLPKHLLEVD